MKTFEAHTRIQASPETVWGILTDAAAYPSWDDTYEKIDGSMAAGASVTLHHREISPKILPMTVTVFEPGRRMVWSGGGMPATMFKGERVFELEADGEGGTRFTARLEFSGLMAPVITKSLPDLSPHLAHFAESLKRRAEE
jgi:hypothetical protein